MVKKMKPIGNINYSAFHGVDVYEIDDELVKFKAYRPTRDGTIRSKMITAKMRYNNKGEPYFNQGGHRLYLKDIIRLNL